MKDICTLENFLSVIFEMYHLLVCDCLDGRLWWRQWRDSPR